MKNILITGASSGIGLACCENLANTQYIVYATVRNDNDIEKLARISQNIRPIKLDITNHIEVDKFFQKITQLDIVFNNAGLAASGPAEFQNIETFKKLMDVNFISQVYITQKCIPLLRKSNDPRLIFTSSAAGILAKPMMSSYSASKFALEAFIDTIRVELAPWKIKVISIEPGKIKTKIYDKSRNDLNSFINLLPENAKALYGELLEVAKYNIDHADEMSSDVSVIVKIFMESLLSKNPKTRYIIGGDASIQKIISKFPDKIRDKIILDKINKTIKRLKK